MICLRGTFYPRVALLATFALTWPLAFAGAQEKPAQSDKTGTIDALKQHDDELKATRDAQRKSADTEAALKREIEQIGADRRKLNQDLIDTAARLRGVEGKVEATQARLEPLDDNQRRIQK